MVAIRRLCQNQYLLGLHVPCLQEYHGSNDAYGQKLEKLSMYLHCLTLTLHLSGSHLIRELCFQSFQSLFLQVRAIRFRKGNTQYIEQQELCNFELLSNCNGTGCAVISQYICRQECGRHNYGRQAMFCHPGDESTGPWPCAILGSFQL